MITSALLGLTLLPEARWTKPELKELSLLAYRETLDAAKQSQNADVATYRLDGR